MTSFLDPEFGEILVRKHPLSRSVKVSVSPSGRLRISTPLIFPDFLIKEAISQNRVAIRQLKPRNPATQRARDQKIKLLRKKAAHYLPARLDLFAQKFHYRYQKIRLAHNSSNWGSCTTTGTITLNIALMQLPSELIDYVIIHELAHLRHPDHSAAFWQEVAQHDPQYLAHRQALKARSPIIQ